VSLYANPGKEFARLATRGFLHKVATGYYAVVPPRATDRTWLPSLEAVAYGIPAADYGPDVVVLMGLSAARLHGAVPRGLAVATVAVEKYRPNLKLTDRPAGIVFVRRDTARLDAERLSIDLGGVLVTGVEQTLLDLAHRPERGGVPNEARTAVEALWPRADETVLHRLARAQRLNAALRRARDWAGM
jgi:predicted transcriptional regulator of viral defense system